MANIDYHDADQYEVTLGNVLMMVGFVVFMLGLIGFCIWLGMNDV